MGLPFTSRSTGRPASRTCSSSVSICASPGCALKTSASRASLRRMPEHALHVGHRLAPRGLDGADGLEGHVRLLAEDALSGARLDDDDVERVADRVVQLARQAGALERDRLLRASVAVGGEERRPLALARRVEAVLLDDGAEDPQHGEDDPDAQGRQQA